MTGQSSHQVLIQKLLVSTHYLTLFRDELKLVERTPSILGSEFPVSLVQTELGDIITLVDTLNKQQRLIESTFWYEEPAFKLMNKALDIVDNWIKGIDDLIKLCQSKEVFQAIVGDKRTRVFGVLIDVFSSLKISTMSLKEFAAPAALCH
ncbi:TPA: hypothetical protein TUW64_001505 [Streptococcus equi subsp. zooepidemicus]|uniref:Uncharacterized protein n=1 Tax=Streptococcus equi subsp. zooepidemicus TaxID=40041 RepID=A0A7Z8ZV00_STRSZ|nr:hypothetical protein [Streptococcus equi]QTZ56836.1 hypothetical protein JFMEOBDD_00915 [Streptococcus equi subsp. zooepidemicus]VEF05984.1 Uncharacterised protein [Streptococcus equi subsp. zooepidemicus]HEL0663754.1 hypothetical protein [Streptococcus equi subsp. zooepidemicus]HEL0704586.1 hypothetical protein [Streptococcus equi subsp. zooepidemicus]HEL1320692.1 hypothetical protein [Streptococcus equi subsp. zooepidemicus]